MYFNVIKKVYKRRNIKFAGFIIKNYKFNLMNTFIRLGFSISLIYPKNDENIFKFVIKNGLVCSEN